MMRFTCPLCGPRDKREFYYYGAEDYLNRPAPDAPPEAWDSYLHLRDNPAYAKRAGQRLIFSLPLQAANPWAVCPQAPVRQGRGLILNIE